MTECKTLTDNPLGKIATVRDPAGGRIGVSLGDSPVLTTGLTPDGEIETLTTTGGTNAVASVAYTDRPNDSVVTAKRWIAARLVENAGYDYHR